MTGIKSSSKGVAISGLSSRHTRIRKGRVAVGRSLGVRRSNSLKALTMAGRANSVK